ncbi:hypothetical protein HGRIS_001585 [Hohenbuehelia grisea]|uniref:Uncharacterized protein n=1 Tax=Hohenbuehelia grisea TaxID=104357 RepID=A0ABR3JRP6_9AGAR
MRFSATRASSGAPSPHAQDPACSLPGHTPTPTLCPLAYAPPLAIPLCLDTPLFVAPVPLCPASSCPPVIPARSPPHACGLWLDADCLQTVSLVRRPSGRVRVPTCGSRAYWHDANDEDQEEEKQTLRLSALEFMVSLSEAKPSMVKKVDGWIGIVVRACLKGMGEFDESESDAAGLNAWLQEDLSTTSTSSETDSAPALRAIPR